jgi:hypothetical protein
MKHCRLAASSCPVRLCAAAESAEQRACDRLALRHNHGGNDSPRINTEPAMFASQSLCELLIRLTDDSTRNAMRLIGSRREQRAEEMRE